MMRWAGRAVLVATGVLATLAPPSAAGPAPGGPVGGTGPAVSQLDLVFDSLTDAERVGQLLMVDCPSTAVTSATLTAIRTYHVGSVILDGTSYAGIDGERAVTSTLQAAAPARIKLFIATDQEGGLVRRMRGPGFSDIPSALVQGTWSPWWLQAEATMWGRELARAGIDVDLAPVLDTVPAGDSDNPPIGQLDREFGYTPATVTAHGTAVLRGLAAAGVAATVKHFPGLGRVTASTDTSAGVTDRVTTSTDPYLAPFTAAVRAGAPFVMMSTAVYSRIDATSPAAFSARIVTGLLRDTIGFRGIVISDDLGQARQVAGYPVGSRAVRFLAAGGDIVLTVDATQAAAMSTAVLSRLRSDPAFRALVYAAVRRVLTAKLARGLTF